MKRRGGGGQHVCGSWSVAPANRKAWCVELARRDTQNNRLARTFTCLSTMRTGAPRSYLQLSLDFTETQTLSARSISILLPNTHIKMHPHQHRVLSYQYPMCSPAAALSDPSLDGKRDRPPLRRPWAWRRLRRALFERLAWRARRRKAHVLIVMAILRKVLVDLACRV